MHCCEDYVTVIKALTVLLVIVDIYLPLALLF